MYTPYTLNVYIVYLPIASRDTDIRNSRQFLRWSRIPTLEVNDE
jgi:hypothetical protein